MNLGHLRNGKTSQPTKLQSSIGMKVNVNANNGINPSHSRSKVSSEAVPSNAPNTKASSHVPYEQYLTSTSNIINNLNFKINMIKKNTKSGSIGNLTTTNSNLNKKELYNVLSAKTKKDLLNLHIESNNGMFEHYSGKNSPKRHLEVSISDSNIDNDLDVLYEYKRTSENKGGKERSMTKLRHDTSLNKSGFVLNKSSSHLTSPKYRNMINSLKTQFNELTKINDKRELNKTTNNFDGGSTNPPLSNNHSTHKDNFNESKFMNTVKLPLEKENGLSHSNKSNNTSTHESVCLSNKFRGKVQNYYKKAQHAPTKDSTAIKPETTASVLPDEQFYNDQRYKAIQSELEKTKEEIKFQKEENEDLKAAIRIMKEYMKINQDVCLEENKVKVLQLVQQETKSVVNKQNEEKLSLIKEIKDLKLLMLKILHEVNRYEQIEDEHNNEYYKIHTQILKENELLRELIKSEKIKDVSPGRNVTLHKRSETKINFKNDNDDKIEHWQPQVGSEDFFSVSMVKSDFAKTMKKSQGPIEEDVTQGKEPTSHRFLHNKICYNKRK